MTRAQQRIYDAACAQHLWLDLNRGCAYTRKPPLSEMPRKEHTVPRFMVRRMIEAGLIRWPAPTWAGASSYPYMQLYAVYQPPAANREG